MRFTPEPLLVTCDRCGKPAETFDGLHPDQPTSNALSQKIIDVLDFLAPECVK